MHTPLRYVIGAAVGAAVLALAALPPGGAAPSKTTTKTALRAAPNPSAEGQLVTLTASVTAAKAETPTGTVAFTDGKSTLGSATLKSGVATLTTSKLALGDHALRAAYAGADTFASSRSSTVHQRVEGSDLRATVTAPKHFGDTAEPLPVTFGVVNDGPVASDNPTVTLSVPHGINLSDVTASSSNPDAATCTTGARIVCTLKAPLPAGKSDSFTARVGYPSQKATKPKPVTVTVSVASTTLDPKPKNNTATATTTSGNPPGKAGPSLPLTLSL